MKGDVTSRTLATGDGCDEHKVEFYEAPVRILPGRIFFLHIFIIAQIDLTEIEDRWEWVAVVEGESAGMHTSIP